METLIPGTRPAVLPTESNVAQHSGPDVRIGYSLLMISVLLFVLKEYSSDTNGDDFLMIFFGHYFMALAYAGYLLYSGSLGLLRSWKRENIHNTVILINLFLVSAYALNRVVEVFQDSVTWVCAFIVITSFNGLSYRYYERLPRWVHRVQHFIIGAAIMFYLYLAFFVANYYIFGFIGILALGIGAHIFMPILLITMCIALIRGHGSSNKGNKRWVAAGAAAAALCSMGFVVEWNLRVSAIEKFANQSVIFHDTQLPTWVTVGEIVKNDWITERILKSDLVYTTAAEKFGEWEFFPRLSNWAETRKHDPLVFLGSMKAKSSLSEEDRIKILKSIYNARHESEERLWSGNFLTTSYIVSDVDIYTDLRIAYTEKYFNIRNNDISRGGVSNPQEALYTFQLPEGSVVTSLSLWINGKEEKGILTSKQKASNAYKAIVGVERRDPSVVHWQEGNTITVRVFPCTNLEERRFKIGVTTPLTSANGRAVYQDLQFRGPDAASARQTTRISIIGSSEGIDMGAGFIRNSKGEYVSEHIYDEDLEITFPARPLTKNRFTFAGFAYSLEEYKPSFQQVSFEDIYADLNKTWTADEVNALEAIISRYRVFVYSSGDRLQLTQDNWREVTSRLGQRNFSLFPFHLLENKDNSLVITKGDIFTPQVSDIKGSSFAEGMKRFFRQRNEIKVFNLEGGLSTYIKSLRELRAINVVTGTVDHLMNLLESNKFARIEEDDSTVLLHDASLIIRRNPASTPESADNAPDHLARLFAYNNIMRQVGPGYFNEDFVNDALVREASTAYVVSPVSSLIVLETVADYQRFGIRDEGDSLFNASKQSTGAVPEPHEWALIILFVLFVIYVRIRN